MTSISVPAARLVFSAEDRKEIASLIDEALSTGSLTLGPITTRLEHAFATRHGVAHAIAVNSGTAALEIILRSLGVEGKEVIVPANTFFASAAAVMRAGGRPRLADIDPVTLALSLDTIEAALTPETAGVMLVHIGGVVTPQVQAIGEFCAARGLFFMEDAAHAHGAGFDGRPAGSFGQAAAFSFYPTKVITTAEGGVIVTNNAGLRDEAVIYRDQGKAGFLGGDHVRLGSAFRLSELHAAVGVVQLARLDEFIATRRSVAAMYDAALPGVPGISAVAIPTGCEPNYYKYIAMLDRGIDRVLVKQRLRDEHRVSLTGEVYALPLHGQPIFADLPHGDLSVTDDVCARHVCLPVHSDMTKSEAEYVIASLHQVMADL